MGERAFLARPFPAFPEKGKNPSFPNMMMLYLNRKPWMSILILIIELGSENKVAPRYFTEQTYSKDKRGTFTTSD